ncbi:MAG TPA: hypothetical protein VFB37_02075 [Steroidobacteraceae bacterium]|nr:hypothetical protein [Steroidobacteraceae bacterium]
MSATVLEECAELGRFMRGETDPACFPHREHVRMGFEMLRRHDFAEAAFRYSDALRSIVTKAGKAKIFHQTITIAFLSLIAERMEAAPYPDFETFAIANGDLIDKSALRRCYRAERLASEAARRTFLLPEPIQRTP